MKIKFTLLKTRFEKEKRGRRRKIQNDWLCPADWKEIPRRESYSLLRDGCPEATLRVGCPQFGQSFPSSTVCNYGRENDNGNSDIDDLRNLSQKIKLKLNLETKLNQSQVGGLSVCATFIVIFIYLVSDGARAGWFRRLVKEYEIKNSGGVKCGEYWRNLPVSLLPMNLEKKIYFLLMTGSWMMEKENGKWLEFIWLT